jgi:hypothetical protein
MTVGEYIASTLPGLTVPESFLVDAGLDTGAQYTSDMFHTVGTAMVQMLAGIILAPSVKSVNENGFSMSWDRENLGKYYLWLCKRYGVTPDPDVVSLLGISAITDISDIW